MVVLIQIHIFGDMILCQLVDNIGPWRWRQ